MRKNNKNQKIALFIMFLSMMALGYAFLQANLQINGITKISSNTWDVHFANIQINQDSVALKEGDSAATIDSNNNCKVDFSVTLGVPGDYYEFTVDIVNAGSIDAMIGAITKTLKVNNILVNNIPDYLMFTVTYADGGEVQENHLLGKNESETYLIHLEFKEDIEELPDAATISTSLELEFVQADDSAVPYSGLYSIGYSENGNSNSFIRDTPWPDDASIYYSSIEVQSAWNNITYQSHPYYLRVKQNMTYWKILKDGEEMASGYYSEESCNYNKNYYVGDGHTYTCEDYISSDIKVGKIFIEYVISQEMANNNPGLTAGIYQMTLNSPETMNDDYNHNKEVLFKSFGNNNDYCEILSDISSCEVTGMAITITDHGNIYIGDILGHANSYCQLYVNTKENNVIEGYCH